ncbi:MAG: SpoIIE family protein phosphatase [Aliifodinibius sp.]|nr:SpoIIE family protein phosphatase [Fodinibius sp.]NIV03631.1 SpoIIE family protein phosphatase [Calditrichia bacterium]NIY29068.1 SpoIIE family protein phosphatase [Fodinibius sp.]
MPSTNIPDKLLQLEKENHRLRRAVEELSILNEIATAIGSTLGLNQIIDLVVQKCVKHLEVEQAVVMLLSEPENNSPFRTMARKADTTTQILPYRLDTQLTGWMLKHQKPLVVNDLQNDDRFQGTVDKETPIRSLLSVPLLSKGRMIGIITAFNKKTEEDFTAEDQRLLAIIATQSAQTIENARLLEEEQALLRMREEMRMAYEIQIKLLPDMPPQLNGYDIASKSIPAKDVGGDYFDFIPIEGNPKQLAFCLGDVTGKGIGAALLMANLQATIRSQTLMSHSPKECMSNSNRLIFENTDPQTFVTMFYGILDTQNHTLLYCNAGHDHPFLFEAGKPPDQLKTGGVVLGFITEYAYEEGSISLEPGSRLILYSDGITEAKNVDEEEFGEKRLQQVVTQNERLSSAELVDKIIDAVRYHSGDVPQADDMTLLVVKRKT